MRWTRVLFKFSRMINLTVCCEAAWWINYEHNTKLLTSTRYIGILSFMYFHITVSLSSVLDPKYDEVFEWIQFLFHDRPETLNPSDAYLKRIERFVPIKRRLPQKRLRLKVSSHFHLHMPEHTEEDVISAVSDNLNWSIFVRTCKFTEACIRSQL